MLKKVKYIIHSMFRNFGYEIKKINEIQQKYDNAKKPIGDLKTCLEEIKSRGLECKNIFDIGANKAEWSSLIRNIFPDSKMHLFEPQIELENFLKEFCNKDSNAQYELVGIGAKLEKKIFTVWDDLAGSSFLPPENSSLIKKGKQREIHIITIDEYIKNNNLENPELVKLDIQGFELEALKGASNTFGKTELYILEVSLFPFEDIPGAPDLLEVINFMAEKGYVMYDLAGYARRYFDNALAQIDICFVKENSFLREYKKWE